jgi:hypothetical protein
MLGSENAGELIVPIVMSLIGVALELEELEVPVEPEEPEPVLELVELELLLPHAATLSAVTMAIASTARRWFTVSLLR